MLPTKFRFIWLSSSEKKIFRNWQIRNNNCLWWPCLSTNRNEMCTLFRRPSIDASYQVSVHLAKRFQRRRFLEIDQSETRIAFWRPCLLTIRPKCTIFIEDLPEMLTTKFRLIGQSGFRGEAFLEINQSEKIIACGGHVCQQIGTKWAVVIENLP